MKTYFKGDEISPKASVTRSGMLGAYRSLDEMGKTAQELHAWFDQSLREELEYSEEELDFLLAENDLLLAEFESQPARTSGGSRFWIGLSVFLFALVIYLAFIR